MILRWRTRIELLGVNPFVWVTASQATALAPHRRGPIPVTVQVNGRPDPPWRVNMMPAGDGRFRLYLNGVVRQASGTGVGDLVEVTAGFDRSYRGGPSHPPPSAFERGLVERPAAGRAWSRLPPSRQKEVLRYLAGLRSESAVQRNVEKALSALAGRPGRFLGRQWNAPVTRVSRKKTRRPTVRRPA